MTFKKTGESCSFEVLERHHVVVVQRHQGEISDPFVFDVGQETPAYCTAIGKAILAFRPRVEAIEAFQSFNVSPTKNTIADPTQFVEQLDVVCARGWAIDDLELDENLRCASAPLVEKDRVVRSGLAICGHADRLTLDYTQELAAFLDDCCDSLCQELAGQ